MTDDAGETGEGVGDEGGGGEDDAPTLDDVEDELERIGDELVRWESRLRPMRDDKFSARTEFREWAVPLFRRVVSTLHAAVEALGADIEDRLDAMEQDVEETSTLARAVAVSTSTVATLHQVNVLATAVVAGRGGDEDVIALATGLAESTMPFARPPVPRHRSEAGIQAVEPSPPSPAVQVGAQAVELVPPTPAVQAAAPVLEVPVEVSMAPAPVAGLGAEVSPPS